MIRYLGMPLQTAAALREGASDAYGMVPERVSSDGSGNPCRHCLRDIPAGAEMLILAYRPFSTLGPYSETGPVFLCAGECSRDLPEDVMPPVVASRPQFLLRAYDENERIVYGTGRIVGTTELETVASFMLEEPGVSFLHLRSAGYNCYQLKIERAG